MSRKNVLKQSLFLKIKTPFQNKKAIVNQLLVGCMRLQGKRVKMGASDDQQTLPILDS
jgi:hypothetical protein